MSLPQRELQSTVAAYLAAERETEERNEYLDGFIYRMAGESPEHGAICTNLTASLHTQLLGTPCQVFSKDTKVRSGPLPERFNSTKGLFSYPDVVVVCGKLQLLDEHRDVLLNPTIIIEVTSPTTEQFDRTEKWMRYQRWLPTLSDYILVAQTRPVIEHYQRAEENRWTYTAVSESGSLLIPSIECRLVLAEVYDRVEFPAPIELEASDQFVESEWRCPDPS